MEAFPGDDGSSTDLDRLEAASCDVIVNSCSAQARGCAGFLDAESKLVVWVGVRQWLSPFVGERTTTYGPE